ncbi:MAG: glycoside hydrolase family 3 C-terminal domain-containing protein [Candidatus Azobacteroides sp.]|nr:glycoside hydrolase family 3 C-terminal domain-containing protein [Candidatus Azobacteroides sp.]
MKKKILCYIFLFLPVCALPAKTEKEIESRIENLLSEMTLEEKIGQMNQLSYEYESAELLSDIRNGKVGSLLNITDPETINRLQKVAMEESRLGIPLIIGRDVIHGLKTIFPIPLGQAASFDPELVRQGARVAAVESRQLGIHWTFAPMVDISRDARWGRIAESFGEDTYLTGILGAAMVQGFQGDDLSSPTSIAACVKHFAGYGAAEGGRDYNSTYISPVQMRNVYLPPFRKAIEAGAATIMTSFNDNDGIPASGNPYLLKDILRKEWNFDGFVVSDWASVSEMIVHGYAKDGKDAARLATEAGVDMEMVSRTYTHFLPELIKEGKITEEAIDQAVRNILRVKFRMNLFEHPYADTHSPSLLYAPEHLEKAKQAALASAILLKNEDVLPLNESQHIAVIGPMAHAPHDQLGTWVFDGEKARTVTPLNALQTTYGHIRYTYEPGLAYSRDKNPENIQKAVQVARNADVAVVFLGEESILSGEAHSLSTLDLQGLQSELLKEIKNTGKPVVLVIMAGRPLTIQRDLPYADAVLYNFHPGTMGGPAILDLLYGKYNPSGKLPVTFVKETGQIPLYYNHNNTGRPAPEQVVLLDEIPLEASQTSLGNTSFYLDSGKDPLFPFGFGLSYTTFEYSGLLLSAPEIRQQDTLTIQVTVKNTGDRYGTETAQLYVRDLVGSVVRPVKELKGFRKVNLQPGEEKTISFTLSAEDLAFYGRNLTRKAEPGEFLLSVGRDSKASLQTKFYLKEKD